MKKKEKLKKHANDNGKPNNYPIEYKETQKYVEDSKYCDFPVTKIALLSPNELSLTARNQKAAKIINGTLRLWKIGYRADQKDLGFDFSLDEKDQLKLFIEGDLESALSSFAETYMISNTLKQNVLNMLLKQDQGLALPVKPLLYDSCNIL